MPERKKDSLEGVVRASTKAPTYNPREIQEIVAFRNRAVGTLFFVGAVAGLTYLMISKPEMNLGTFAFGVVMGYLAAEGLASAITGQRFGVISRTIIGKSKEVLP